jgi:hypothetical protein
MRELNRPPHGSRSMASMVAAATGPEPFRRCAPSSCRFVRALRDVNTTDPAMSIARTNSLMTTFGGGKHMPIVPGRT